jgi:hypothetical protein
MDSTPNFHWDFVPFHDCAKGSGDDFRFESRACESETGCLLYLPQLLN